MYTELGRMKDGVGMDNATLARVLARLLKEVGRVEQAANDVLIGEENFRVLSRYFETVRSILAEFSDKKVSDPASMQVVLMAMEQEVAKACDVATRCSSKSKFYLIVKCEAFLKEIEDITHEIGRCLDSVPVATLDLAVETQETMTKLSGDMRKAQFKPAIAEKAIIYEINEGIRNRQTNSEFANDLLLQIARAAGVATDPTSLKDELEILKREKEDTRAQGNQDEYQHLGEVIALLSRADAATSASEKDVNYQKKRGSGGMGGHPIPPLQSFYCPITHEIMEEPVEIASGQTFERTAIEKWFSAGNSNCPTTKVELDNLEIKLNLALRQSIQEWKERNIAISIAATTPKLDRNREESEICAALRTLLTLSEEKGIHRYWIALEGLIPSLVDLLQSHQRIVRKETLEVLRSLSVDNTENKVLPEIPFHCFGSCTCCGSTNYVEARLYISPLPMHLQ